MKKSHSKQRRNPTIPYTEQNKTKQELGDKRPHKIKEKKRNTTKLLKIKINAVTKDKQLGKKA